MIDLRFKQANREALYALGLTLIYLMCWILCAYCTSMRAGLFGFPIWFELTCFFTPVFFILMTFLMIRFLFKIIPLDEPQS